MKRIFQTVDRRNSALESIKSLIISILRQNLRTKTTKARSEFPCIYFFSPINMGVSLKKETHKTNQKALKSNTTNPEKFPYGAEGPILGSNGQVGVWETKLLRWKGGVMANVFPPPLEIGVR